jgi:hypothetical protein
MSILEGALVKKGHAQIAYTAQQKEELRRCLNPVSGPMYFLENYFYLQHAKKGKMLFVPYDFQKELINNYHNYRFSINMCSRQMGKCLAESMNVTVKNNKTNKIYDLPIGIFYEFNLAKKQGLKYSIDCYERKNDQTTIFHVTESDFKKNPRMYKLSEQVERKFTNQIDLDDEWSIETDTGWQPLEQVSQTIPYERWSLLTESGLTLDSADNHIVFDNNYQEVFVQDLLPGDIIITKNGPESIINVSKKDIVENMYDVSVNSPDHRFYSNGILSHNTQCAAGYLLWKGMFVPDQTILIASNKYTGAAEIMQRLRYAYEHVPDFIRAGVTTYNKGSIEFDNGSRIISATTTETTGRGMAISLLYCDELAFVRPSISKQFWTSISPTLSTGGGAIITSTPNSDQDQFADLWFGANKTIDAVGNETDVGINGFKAFKATWDEHPDRDEEWAIRERNSIGELKFRIEHLCIAGPSLVSIKDEFGNIEQVTIEELYNRCG